MTSEGFFRFFVVVFAVLFAALLLALFMHCLKSLLRRLNRAAERAQARRLARMSRDVLAKAVMDAGSAILVEVADVLREDFGFSDDQVVAFADAMTKRSQKVLADKGITEYPPVPIVL